MVVRELAIAQEFGRSDQVDAYFIAYLVPLTLMQVIVGSFGPALMPEYLKVRQHEGVPAGKRLFAACLSWASVVLLAVTGALAAGIDLWLPLLTSGFEHEKRVLTGKLFMLLLPSLCLSGIASLWTTALNAERRFVLGALTPAVVPLGAIVSLMVFAKEYGVEALAVGTLAGHALQCALLIPALQRRDIPVLPRWQRRNEQMASVVRQYLPAASGALLMSTTTFVNQGMAAMIDPGSVAALSYGNKVVNFVLGIGALALSSAVLPEFSRMTSESDWFGIRRTMKTYSALILIGGGVVALLLYVVSEPLVAAIFQRGAFGERDTSTVAQVQALYVLQIPFYLVGITLVRLIAALQLNYILLWGTVINVSANVVLNLLFIRWLGVAGIALSTSVVYLIAMIFFGLAVVRRLSTRISGEAQQVVITCAQKL
jgi:putative peptidoglycan lipid II flippase